MPDLGQIPIECVDYGPGFYAVTQVENLDSFLELPRPEQAAVRWINVNGLHAYPIRRLQEQFSFHSLAAEDILHAHQRPKVEAYEESVFVVCQMLVGAEGGLSTEQVSMVLLGDTLITFQEKPGDVWDRVRGRISAEDSRFRSNRSGYLVYALLDAIVDNFFPALESFSDHLDEIELQVLEQPRKEDLQRLYQLKQELVMLRRVIWPTRQAVDELQRMERKEMDKKARTYLRDVYDHSLQVMDLVEAFRDTASSLTDLYMSSVANRMNEIMKVLTIMASLFIPVTFLAGVYGMNFQNIPELGWKWAYPSFWGLCLLTLGGLLYYFRRKGWLGER